MLEIAPALLEKWMREYYFETDIDIGSSGVESFSLGELRKLVGIEQADLDSLVFDDSPTLGAPGLREAIARRWADGRRERVIATHGSSEAIYLTMNALLQAGDEIVVLDPCYQQLFSIAESIGCVVKRWPLLFEHHFIPNVEEAKRLIDRRTRMVVVNSPHNPTGAMLDWEDRQRLIDAVAQVGAYLVWDGAFAELTYSGPRLADPSTVYDRCVSIGTLSKAYGLPGLRVGWCLASPDLLERFAHFRDYTILHLSPLTELIAQRVVENADLLVRLRMEQARNNLSILTEWIGRHSGSVRWVPPKGGVCGFLRLCAVQDVDALCRRLACECRTLLVPGTCFSAPGYVRLGFGGPTADLKEGLTRLSNLLTAGDEQRRRSWPERLT